MRYPIVIALGLLLASPALGDFESDKRDCVRGKGWAKINACTRQIRSGRWEGSRGAWAYSNRGNTYNRLGQYRRAIKDLNEAIRLNPRLVPAYNNRGNAYDGLKQYQRAIQDYNQAIRLNPKFAFAYNNRAWTYYNWGKAAQGLPDANRALQLYPRYAGALDTRGHIFEALGRKQEAIRDYRQAQKLNPNHKHSRADLKRLGVRP